MEALGEFTSLISGTLSPPSPFDLLPPPTTVGFLKLSRPCCYVFPAGRGDCAFFAVNGFTVLMDGGSDSQACFWKLVRHLDRVDAVLITHVGTENLPGVNVFLERKVAELELSSDVKGKRLSQVYSCCTAQNLTFASKGFTVCSVYITFYTSRPLKGITLLE